MSKITALYKGPAIHNRVITRKDLLNVDVDESELPKDFKELRWPSAEQGRRRRIDISALGQEVYDILDQDPSMELVKDGEVVSEAAPDAAHSRPDGSSPGIDGNADLAEAIGYNPEEDATEVDGSSSGAGFAEASARSGGGGTAGGSTTGDTGGASTPAGGGTGTVGGSTAGSV